VGRLAGVDADPFADPAFGYTNADWHCDFHRDPNAYTAQFDPDGHSYADSDARPAVSDTNANVDANARPAVPNSNAPADSPTHEDFHSSSANSDAGGYRDTNTDQDV